MHKLCNGKVPHLHPALFDENENALIQEIQGSPARISELIEQYKFREALFEVIDLARKGNQYMQKREPWMLAKKTDTDPTAQQQIDNCLHLCLQLTANLTILINPFLPNTALTLLHMMKVVDRMLDWENAGSLKLLNAGYPLRAPQLLFRKIEDAEVTLQIEKLQKGMTNPIATPASPALPEKNNTATNKPVIQYEDFAKLELRSGIIRKAEKVEKADKLLKLEVELQGEIRTIVSGIAEHYQPSDIIDKQVTVVCNLAPRKMRGIESNGMILMATDRNGKLHFVHPEHPIEPGSLIS
jgi:methionyl-tRNA synthetase